MSRSSSGPDGPMVSELKSPASPIMSGSVVPGINLATDLQKAATVFPSHIRRTFSRFPVDYTGELVRLLDDLSTVTHSIAAYISQGAESTEYGQRPDVAGLDPNVATKQLYKSLCHDGYACLILDRNYDTPLTLPEDAPHGGYVVVVSALDLDPTLEYQAMCGTVFSIYKKRSPPSLPGRLKDLQQQLGDQVAAGYVLYSSATTLHYTMNQGVYSFCLHPVATQYFLQPSTALKLGEGCRDVYGDYARAKKDNILGKAVLQFAAESAKRGSFFDLGCVVSNFHGAALTGAIFFCYNAHLLCEAAPLALIIEQMGGRATDGKGNRILDMSVTDDAVHTHTTFLSGFAESVDAIEKLANELPKTS